MQNINDEIWDYKLSKKTILEILFDCKYGKLNNSSVLSTEEYEKHKKWSIDSGFFEFQLFCQLSQKLQK